MPDDPTSRRILHITPADGWFAVIRDGAGDEQAVRIACWALVEETGRVAVQYLVGMDADPVSGGLVDEHEGFSHYVHADDVEDGGDQA